MEDAELTSVLLSGAAVDLEAVVHARDDLTADERVELSELVRTLKRLHEQLAYTSDMLDLPDRAELVDDGARARILGELEPLAYVTDPETVGDSAILCPECNARGSRTTAPYTMDDVRQNDAARLSCVSCGELLYERSGEQPTTNAE